MGSVFPTRQYICQKQQFIQTGEEKSSLSIIRSSSHYNLASPLVLILPLIGIVIYDSLVVVCPFSLCFIIFRPISKHTSTTHHRTPHRLMSFWHAPARFMTSLWNMTTGAQNLDSHSFPSPLDVPPWCMMTQG